MESIAGKSIRELTISHLSSEEACIQFFYRSGTSKIGRMRCLQVCTDCINDNREVIGGPGVEVEIDESLFYRRKYNRGRILGCGWFFGAVERHDHSKSFLMVFPNQKKETLIPIIRERIARGSIIISDCWKAYNELSECGYIHLTVNHSQNFVDRQDRFIHTQNIENFWRWAKNRFLSTTKNTEKRLSKISEHLFRKNSKVTF
ncbi:hypothetical protein RF11_05896 [Thelohanellus kitauei]|uniref:ISXO2-like transposase domain-containing protein n=1 Tax=Thelohanellus kitauei TaxID=669202 RepID=A0A0C2JAB6_THEKT|nr:hypothetical protein RF11_05896 [Thelohanellus kitauei]